MPITVSSCVVHSVVDRLFSTESYVALNVLTQCRAKKFKYVYGSGYTSREKLNEQLQVMHVLGRAYHIADLLFR